MSDKVITANNLRDGLVVFLDAEGGWSYAIAGARVIPDAELADALVYAKGQHDARIVVEPYEIEVTREGDAIVPVRLREKIRAASGPTVAYGEAELSERHAAQADPAREQVG